MKPLTHLTQNQTKKQTSEKQTEANQQNAAHSTGPRTEAGKTASSRNAVKHNLNGRFTLLKQEDKAIYAKLAADYILDLQPVGPVEENLVQAIIDAEWRLCRIRAKEEQIVQEAGPEEFNQLHQLSRYESAQHRVVSKSLSDLRAQQKQRKANELERVVKQWEENNNICTFDPKIHLNQVRQYLNGFVLEKCRMSYAFLEFLYEEAEAQKARDAQRDSQNEPNDGKIEDPEEQKEAA